MKISTPQRIKFMKMDVLMETRCRKIPQRSGESSDDDEYEGSLVVKEEESSFR